MTIMNGLVISFESESVPLLMGEVFGVAAPLDGHLQNSLRLILTEKKPSSYR